MEVWFEFIVDSGYMVTSEIIIISDKITGQYILQIHIYILFNLFFLKSSIYIYLHIRNQDHASNRVTSTCFRG